MVCAHSWKHINSPQFPTHSLRSIHYLSLSVTILNRKGAPWEFAEDQITAMEDLKQALLTSLSLRPIYYTSMAPVIFSIDTSYIAVRYILSQCDLENSKLWYYAQFGFITLNKRECQFSQPKLKLYGLYRALRLLKLYLIGICNLVIEVDTRYIKGMLQILTSVPQPA